MNFNQFGMTNFIVNGLEGLHDRFTSILLSVISTCGNYNTYYFLSTYNMNNQNGHNMNFHILYSTHNGIRHAKRVEVHPSNIS